MYCNHILCVYLIWSLTCYIYTYVRKITNSYSTELVVVVITNNCILIFVKIQKTLLHIYIHTYLQTSNGRNGTHRRVKRFKRIKEYRVHTYDNDMICVPKNFFDNDEKDILLQYGSGSPAAHWTESFASLCCWMPHDDYAFMYYYTYIPAVDLTLLLLWLCREF